MVVEGFCIRTVYSSRNKCTTPEGCADNGGSYACMQAVDIQDICVCVCVCVCGLAYKRKEIMTHSTIQHR